QIHSSSPSANALSKTSLFRKVSSSWTRAQLMALTLRSKLHNHTRQQLSFHLKVSFSRQALTTQQSTFLAKSMFAPINSLECLKLCFEG
ncbi:unnamed protein product, partial [Oikopleura dioica]